MLFESVIFNLLPIIVGILVVAMVFESCWRKCPPDKLMIVSGFGQMRSVSGKGTFVIPLLQRVDTLSLGAVQVAKPLTAVDSIKMYGSGNAQKLVKETTSIVDQVASGLKDSTGIDLPSLLNGLISNSDTHTDPAESPVD